MADNRMWLIHRPTRLGVMIGRRNGLGWDKAPEQEDVQRFFEYLKINPEGSQDDFFLAMEDCATVDCFSNWKYGKNEIDGFMEFIFT